MLAREAIRAWRCECTRCAHVWHSVGVDPPRACARCKSTRWNFQRRKIGPAALRSRTRKETP